MRGHTALIAMRQRHRRPGIVCVDIDHDDLRCWRDWHLVQPSVAQVQIDPDDSPELLDLRCLIGLTVLVTGSDADRVHAIAQAAQGHEAARVITACLAQDHRGDWHVTESTDTLEAACG